MSKSYSIGEVAHQFGLSISTIRYYDKQGLIPNLNKDQTGNRTFTEQNMATIKIIQCLKLAGMQIKDIKVFIHWCLTGDSTLELRKAMFDDLQVKLNKKMHQLGKILDEINFKQAYYTKAIADGTEKYVREMSPDKVMQTSKNLNVKS
ncbi:MerR family transcriptional regulator [Pediococcus ethanolidurans]|uniref:MerR family transcriptional regulator n=1 Tax=Pediococcus ethanolidurans TaxID=319653 RepID=UPI001C1F026D|nr:MerR family transcriptional regulator [Pediococcus ethanolidurans]MBU7563805.1 MerR family transcriptional regulator [Pediococcus ethanolidurans]